MLKYGEKKPIKKNHIPFTPKFLQIDSPPVFFCIFFCNFHGNSLRREYCTKTKQDWPDSGSTLENIFCNFYEINSSQDSFLYCKNFGVDGKGIWRSDAPEASQGRTRDVPGTPGTFGPDLCVNQY